MFDFIKRIGGVIIRCFADYPYSLSMLLMTAALAVPFCTRAQSEWDEVYVRAARNLSQGQDIYQLQDGYLYPPFMALSAVPFVNLSTTASRALWFVVNVISLTAILRFAWLLSGGKMIQGGGVPRREHLIFWAGIGCGGYYLLDTLAHQQTDLLVAALALGGCFALQRSHAYLAAGCFGMAAACKCTPLLFAPYLVWRGRPLAACWMLAVALAANMLPDFVSSAPSGSWLCEWVIRYLLPTQSGSGGYTGTWGSAALYNLSLAGVAHHWLLSTWEWTHDGVTIRMMTNPIPTDEFGRIVTAGRLILLVTGVVLLWHRPFQKGVAELRAAAEYSAILILMLLLSPMSSKPHFCTLMLPGLCLAREACRPGAFAARVALAAAILSGLLANKDLVGRNVYTLVLWYGGPTLSAAALFAGCAIILSSVRRSEPAARAEFATESKRAA